MHHEHSHEQAPQTRGLTISWAHRYDLVANLMMLGQERKVRAMTAEMAGIKPGDKVLDVGCGTGSLTLAAQARAGASGEVYGIDASPQMIEVARIKAARAGAPIDFQVALIEQLPFPDDTFDVVLSSLMIHHLPDDLKRQGFAEIRRVLKPGGHLFAIDFEPPTSALALHLLAHLFSHRMMQIEVRAYVPLLEEAGLKDVQTGRTRSRYLSFVRGSKG